MAVLQQPGVLSAFGYAVEATPGTFVPPTDILDVESLQVTDDPAIIEFSVMRKSRNPVQTTRAGIHKVMANITAPMYAIQGALFWRSLIGFDTVYPAAAAGSTTLTAPSAAAATTINVTSATGIIAGVYLLLDTGANQESVKVVSIASLVVTIAGDNAGGLKFAHATGSTVQIAQGGVTVAASIGAQTVTVSALPALPGAIAEYTGTFVQIDTEVKLILGITGAGPYVLTVTPLLSAKTVNGAAFVPQHHILQEQTGTNQPIMQTISAAAQFAQMMEWDLSYGYPMKGGIKGDTKTLKEDFNFCFGALPVPTTTISPITPSAAEAADSPWIMRDGGLITNFTTADAAPSMHNRVLSLDWELDNGMLGREYGGGVQNAEFYVPGERKQTIKWKEDAGQASGNPDIWTNYVKTQTPLPAFMQFVNSLNNAYFGAWFPSCRAIKYDGITALSEPVGYDGELLPLQDSVSGKSIKVAIYNGISTAY